PRSALAIRVEGSGDTVPELSHRHGRDRHVIGAQRAKSCANRGRPSAHRMDQDVGIQEPAHSSSRSTATSPAPIGSSRPSSRSFAERAILSQYREGQRRLAIGSRTTESPSWCAQTSSPSKRSSFGRRTACERPFMNSFARMGWPYFFPILGDLSGAMIYMVYISVQQESIRLVAR